MSECVLCQKLDGKIKIALGNSKGRVAADSLIDCPFCKCNKGWIETEDAYEIWSDLTCMCHHPPDIYFCCESEPNSVIEFRVWRCTQCLLLPPNMAAKLGQKRKEKSLLLESNNNS